MKIWGASSERPNAYKSLFGSIMVLATIQDITFYNSKQKTDVPVDSSFVIVGLSFWILPKKQFG
jgi:hypothetical protein